MRQQAEKSKINVPGTRKHRRCIDKINHLLHGDEPEVLHEMAVAIATATATSATTTAAAETTSANRS